MPGSGFIRMRYPAGTPGLDVEVGGDEPEEVERIKSALRWVYPGKRVGNLKQNLRGTRALGLGDLEDDMSLFDRVALMEFGEKTRFKPGPAYHNSDLRYGRRHKTTPGFFVAKKEKRYPNLHSLSQSLGALRQAYQTENPGGWGGPKKGAGPMSKIAVELARKIRKRFPNICPSVLAVKGECTKKSPLSVFHGGEPHGQGGGKSVEPDYIWPCVVGKGCPEGYPGEQGAKKKGKTKK